MLIAALSAALFALTLAAPSHAHINLRSPAPRVPGIPDSTLSLAPCGQRDSARIPERATTFEPGQRIEVIWDVYVRHPSYFRIAFDLEGEDSFSARRSMPDDPATDDLGQLTPGEGEFILDYIPDPNGNLDRVERTVTLPDRECERCTLQVIQFTYGLPIDKATYHQCADIVLRRSGPVLPDAGTLGPGEPRADAGRDATGCTLAPVRPPALGWAAFGALGVAALARRSARRRQRRDPLAE